jgi:hypothetical protein
MGVVRTGRRDGKHSAKGPALETAANTPGHESAGFNLGLRLQAGHVAVDGEMEIARIR